MIFNMTGGGGGGIELTVVNGSTAPTSPAENTIWVLTTATIGNVYVSPTAPSSPATGDVWVNTSGTAVCVMTLSEDPTAEVNISGFKIYQNGAWAEPGGGIQCGGVWYDLTAKVYGIKRSLSSSSPAWTRTDASANFTATASVGTSAGSSDFDNCYPWSGMVRETLSTGDVMVKIPKFYYKRYRDSSYEYIQIADNPKDGFALHPAFNHGGVATDCVYVGAYKTVSGHKSASGSKPLASLTRAQFRSNAQSKGSGWGIIDLSTVSAIQMLYLVEFANSNSQAMIGRGYVDKTSSGASINTGTTNSVANLTGRASGTDGLTDVVYRGVEGFWGNVYEWTDGLNCYGGSSGETYYICNNPDYYADDTSSNYTKLGFLSPASSNYITLEGLDSSNSYAILPVTASGGSESSYECDYCYCTTTAKWYVLFRGGSWYDGSKAGLFYAFLYVGSSDSRTSVGSRLLYIPS